MTCLLQLAGCLAALILIGAAFAYPFNPKPVKDFLTNFAVAALALALFPALLWHVLGADPLIGSMVLLTASLTAYFIRERRMRGRNKPRPVGRAERVPVVPPQLPRDNR